MKSLLIALVIAVSPLLICARQAPQEGQEQGTPPATAAPIKTERIDAAALPKAQAPTSEAGYMDRAQVKDFLHKIWLAQFRINDLLSQINPTRWKVEGDARSSTEQTLDNLRKTLAVEEDWRGQFEGRTDSLYLGFETYVAINAVLPRLQGVTESVFRYENASIGAQFSQAGLHLFDLQQALRPYLEYLLRNQDKLIYATQTNLAACQNELGYAMSGQSGPAKPMKNIAPKFKGHPRSRRKAARTTNVKEKKAQTPEERKAEELAGVKSAAETGSKETPPKSRPDGKKD